jgi:hypothetical protein
MAHEDGSANDAGARNVPSFLIVGTMKSGTSTLASQLDHSPGIRVPSKELHYFNRDRNFERGIDWYSSHFADVPPGTMCGEKTPTYSYSATAPGRIFEFDPAMKLLWTLRNPIDRAYSHYWYGVARGRQSATFEEAITAELDGNPTDPWQRYIHRGRYAEQIERFLSTGFILDQMLFVRFDDLVGSPADVLARTRAFLGFRDAGSSSAKNVPKVWRNRSKPGGKAGYPPMPDELRRVIAAQLEESNQRTRELTGIDFTGT